MNRPLWKFGNHLKVREAQRAKEPKALYPAVGLLDDGMTVGEQDFVSHNKSNPSEIFPSDFESKAISAVADTSQWSVVKVTKNKSDAFFGDQNSSFWVSVEHAKSGRRMIVELDSQTGEVINVR